MLKHLPSGDKGFLDEIFWAITRTNLKPHFWPKIPFWDLQKLKKYHWDHQNLSYNLFGVRWHTTTVTHQSLGNLDDFVVKHFRWNTSQLDFFGDCKPYQNDEIRFFFLFFALVKNVYRNNTSKILQILVIKLIFVLKIHFDFTSPLGSIVCVCLCVCVIDCVSVCVFYYAMALLRMHR